METCTLCDLPAPDSPATDDGVEGTFCCRGCLEVTKRLDGLEESAPADSPSSPEASVDTEAPEDAAETFLAVDGMHCTTCESFLDLRGAETDGIYEVDANYAMETARVVYDPEATAEGDLPDLLSGYGYTVRFREETERTGVDRDARKRQRDTVQRLVIGGFFAMLVMPWYFFYLYPSYVGLETGLINVDTTTSLTLYLPMVFVGLFSSIVLFYTGYPVLRGAWVSLRTRQPNMDLLVSVAALSAYAYSTVALATGSTHLYYDVSVAVVMMVTLGGGEDDHRRHEQHGTERRRPHRRNRPGRDRSLRGAVHPSIAVTLVDVVERPGGADSEKPTRKRRDDRHTIELSTRYRPESHSGKRQEPEKPHQPRFRQRDIRPDAVEDPGPPSGGHSVVDIGPFSDGSLLVDSVGRVGRRSVGCRLSTRSVRRIPCTFALPRRPVLRRFGGRNLPVEVPHERHQQESEHGDTAEQMETTVGERGTEQSGQSDQRLQWIDDGGECRARFDAPVTVLDPRENCGGGDEKPEKHRCRVVAGREECYTIGCGRHRSENDEEIRPECGHRQQAGVPVHTSEETVREPSSCPEYIQTRRCACEAIAGVTAR